MPVGISWATLSDQKIVFMNRKFTEIFGYKMGDFEDIANWIEQTYPSPEDLALAICAEHSSALSAASGRAATLFRLLYWESAEFSSPSTPCLHEFQLPFI